MTERTCETCRWWYAGPTGSGYCQRRAPISVEDLWPITGKGSSCGDWQDKNITPEQAERRELTRQFALAIMSTVYGVDLQFDLIWTAAKNMAAAEPQIQREGGK
jgi:hypothetical protein